MAEHQPLSGTDLDRLSTKILALLNSAKPLEDLITDIVRAVQRDMSFEAVGLRLADGLDFPYWFTRGFDRDLIEKGLHLCSRDREGELIRRADGSPGVECMCGNVIAGRTDPKFLFFTEGGSFWSNSATHVSAPSSEEDRKAGTGNRCISEGYESVALIPVKAGGTTHGLLQLSDRRRDMFTLELVCFLEGVAASIALLFSMKRERDRLQQHAGDLTRLTAIRTQLLDRIAAELRNGIAQDENERARSQVLHRLEGILNELQLLKGLLPICSRCKKIRNEAGDWERIEVYVRDRSGVEFSHTLCPECFRSWEIDFNNVRPPGKP